MYFNVLKSLKHRKYISLNVKKKWFLNIILKNHFLFYNIYNYNSLKSKISICKLRIRCIINGKSRSNDKKFKLSRFFLKDYSIKGKLNGVKKL